MSKQLAHLVKDSSLRNGVIVCLHGPYGVGKQSTAEAVCREQGLRLLVIDLEHLSRHSEASTTQMFQFVQREAKLHPTAVYWQGFDTLLQEDKKSLFMSFLDALENRPALTFLAGEKFWEPTNTLRGMPLGRVELRRPNFTRTVTHLVGCAQRQSHTQPGCRPCCARDQV